jgi:molecular chaperone DnaK
MARVGIDLGTCNSVIATMEDNRVEVIPNEAGKLTTPSVVFFNSAKLDDASVGETAVFSAGSNPSRVVRFIKKHMGEDIKVPIDDQTYTPEEISSRILQTMIRDAEQNFFGGEKITDAVITVPAWFDLQRRDATKRAGEMAGLVVRAVFAEPIAAAIDFVQSPHGEQLEGKTLLVYDLGGGTFDATLITVTKAAEGSALEFHVLNKKGSVDLGGYNWDIALRDYVAGEFAKANGGNNPTDDPISADLLMLECQRAKEVLSTKKREDALSIPCTHQGVTFSVEMTRGQLEQLTQHLLNESIDMVSTLIEDTFRPLKPDVSKEALWDSVDMILLAGGSTKMPIVVETLERLSGKKPRTNKGVDLNVGRGAAYVMFSPDLWVWKEGIDAAEKTRMAGQGPKKAMTGAIDTATQSIGVNIVNPNNEEEDINCVLIRQGDPCGKEYESMFGVYRDGQTAVDVVINTGDAEDLSQVEQVGRVRVSGLPSTTKAGEEIKVTLSLDGNGLITGSAKHVLSGKDAQIRVELTPKKMMRDSAA